MEENKTTQQDENSKPQFAIFDWIVSLPVIRILKPLYEWKKSFWIYCFLGFLSTGSNYIMAILFAEKLNMMGSVANIVAWIPCLSPPSAKAAQSFSGFFQKALDNPAPM